MRLHEARHEPPKEWGARVSHGGGAGLSLHECDGAGYFYIDHSQRHHFSGEPDDPVCTIH